MRKVVFLGRNLGQEGTEGRKVRNKGGIVSVPQKKGGIVSGMVQSVMLSSFIYSGAT
jgi:hypothetical protein